MEAVDQVLAQRVQRSRQSSRALRPSSLAAALLLHAAALAALWIAPSLSRRPPPLDFVPVQIIPAQALGVERPLGRPKAEAPRPAEPAPPKPEPAPPEPKPEPEPEQDTRPTPPREEVKPRDERPAPPRPPEPKPTKPPNPTPGASQPAAGKTGPGGVAAVGKGEELGRRGSAAGNPLGTSGLGSAIAGLEDPNFGYGYYIDQLLQLIDAQWNRPPLGGEVRAVLFFRILRNGSIEDLEVEESSGYNSFDLAALRAVQNAVPFPALPASYRNPSLGVHLIVH